MSRLVVISNRLAIPQKDGTLPAGGLAVGVHAALQETGGIWFGWNGETVESRQHAPDIVERDGITYATVGLTERDINEYYNGFSNSAMWPLLHYRLDLARFERRDFLSYMRVNDQLAQSLLPLLKPDDTIWIHDYHLIPLARSLRQQGVRNRLGFFLHTPFPPADIFAALPRHGNILRAMCDYDLLGFQTQGDLAAFHNCLDVIAKARISDDDTISAFGRTTRAGVFPIGLDTENVRTMAAQHDDSEARDRLQKILLGRGMIVGVERLDYSKGLPQRFEAYRELLDIHQGLRRNVTFMQIAPPSRSDVYGYGEIRTELENLTGNINGIYADFDWVPVRYLNRSFSRDMLTCFYREAQVGLVTPLRDGMNLVAKEYIASQDPDSPGALVLSKFAGAADQMKEALIVNPYDTSEVANALYHALNMSLRERRKRWRALMDGLVEHDIQHWRRAFLDALSRTEVETV